MVARACWECLNYFADDYSKNRKLQKINNNFFVEVIMLHQTRQTIKKKDCGESFYFFEPI